MPKARWPVWLWAAAGAIVCLFLAIVLTSSSGLNHSAGDPDQVAFRKKAAEDRAGLFDGLLECQRERSVDVDETFKVSAVLTGLHGPLRPPRAQDPTRVIPVGGVQGALLHSSTEDLRVEAIGTNRRYLPTPADRVEWQWNVTPRKPGQYKLDLVVETYQGDTENVLASTDPPIEIAVTVNGTLWYRLGEAKEWIIAAGALVTAAGVIAAMFRKPLTAIVARRRHRSAGPRSHD
ncbi:hypothetical protein [Streptomyces zaomyceticus]|uniref:hypothetical protein n=1 Tax=Streptomyces zaomyceticus TaxID=68286 RepID=UPI003681E137